MKKDIRNKVVLSVLGIGLLGMLSVGGYYLLRYSGSDVDASVERVIYEGQASDSALIYADGMTQETRIGTPAGYERVPADAGSLLAFMRNMEVLPHGNPIVTYAGDELNTHCAAVYALDIGAHDLQQCADSVIRVYSEYFWSQEEYDRIAFHLTNGELMQYTDWRDGKRLVAAGSFTKQLKLASENSSYACFRAYLECVMHYAGTKSLYAESETIPLSDLRPGDLLLIPGAPGHVILTVDIATNADGETCWLFAQGFMPAQSFHMIENDAHPDDPWYYSSELEGTFRVGSYSFNQENIRRWQDGF
ncbi:MAG: hypothetical protein IJY85_10020 [Ruminococcus sp.]|nr:hypothetical protein [Ruminococcus sp.]